MRLRALYITPLTVDLASVCMYDHRLIGERRSMLGLYGGRGWLYSLARILSFDKGGDGVGFCHLGSSVMWICCGNALSWNYRSWHIPELRRHHHTTFLLMRYARQ